MPVLAPALIYPRGRIHPDLFPDRAADLESDVTVWLQEAYALPQVAALEVEAEQDAAAKAWAYYRAFDAACIAMAANPTSASQTDAGASAYAKDQRERVCQNAADALADFHERAPKQATNRYTGGQTIPHTFAW